MHVDVRVLELLTSRICHDLVSPVGAVGNGVELLREFGADGLGDSLPLLEHSASQASVRLQMFRLAYGAGGSEAMVSGKQVYEAFKNYIAADEKYTFVWDLMCECPGDPPLGFLKVLSNALMIAKEFLPRGGTITVRMPEMMDCLMYVEATGETVKVKDDVVPALSGEAEITDLDPKSVGPYMAGLFARHFNVSLTLNTTETAATFTLKA